MSLVNISLDTTILDSLGGFVWVLDPSTCAILWQNNATEDSGEILSFSSPDIARRIGKIQPDEVVSDHITCVTQKGIRLLNVRITRVDTPEGDAYALVNGVEGVSTVQDVEALFAHQAVNFIDTTLTIIRNNGEILFQNNAAEKYYGVHSMSKGASDLFQVRFVDQERTWQELQNKLDQDGIFEEEVEVQTKEGLVNHILTAKRSPNHLGGEDIIIVQELSIPEKRVKVRYDFLENILDAVPIAISVKDIQGSYILFNKMASQVTGIAASEIIGKTDFDIFSQGQAQKFRQEDIEIFVRRSTQFVEQLSDAVRDSINYYSGKVLVGNSGEQNYVLAFGMDTSFNTMLDKKLASSDTFNMVLDANPHGNIIVNQNGNVLYVNKAFADVLGIEKSDLSVLLGHYREGTGPLADVFEKFIDLQLPTHRRVTFKDANGLSRILDVQRTLFEFKGNRRLFFFTVIDVTKNEQALTYSTNEQNAAVRNIYNETSVLLTDGLYRAQALMERMWDEEGVDAVERLSDTMKVAQFSLHDFLHSFNIKDIPVLNLQKTSFDLIEFTESAVDVLALTARDRGISTGTLISEDVPRHVYGDSEQLKKVIVLLVEAVLQSVTQGVLSVMVVPAKQKDHICFQFNFKRHFVSGENVEVFNLLNQFIHTEEIQNEHPGPIGVNIMICNRLIKLSGGTIGIGDIGDSGGQVWFEIPLSGKDRPVEDVKFTSNRILIIDSPYGALQLLHQQMEIWGLHVDTAVSEGQAIDLISNPAHTQAYDVIFINEDMVQNDSLLKFLLIENKISGVKNFIIISYFDKFSPAEFLETKCFRGDLRQSIRQADLREILTLNFDDQSDDDALSSEPPIGEEQDEDNTLDSAPPALSSSPSLDDIEFDAVPPAPSPLSLDDIEFDAAPMEMGEDIFEEGVLDPIPPEAQSEEVLKEPAADPSPPPVQRYDTQSFAKLSYTQWVDTLKGLLEEITDDVSLGGDGSPPVSPKRRSSESMLASSPEINIVVNELYEELDKLDVFVVPVSEDIDLLSDVIRKQEGGSVIPAASQRFSKQF